MTAEPASNKCYEIYFKGPRVFKRRGGNILKMQTCLPHLWGHSNTHQLSITEHAIINMFLARNLVDLQVSQHHNADSS